MRSGRAGTFARVGAAIVLLAMLAAGFAVYASSFWRRVEIVARWHGARVAAVPGGEPGRHMRHWIAGEGTLARGHALIYFARSYAAASSLGEEEGLAVRLQQKPLNAGRDRGWTFYVRMPEIVMIRFPAEVTLIVLTAANVAIWWPQTARLRRRRGGLCHTCGYDLRATPCGCPECGTTPAG